MGSRGTYPAPRRRMHTWRSGDCCHRHSSSVSSPSCSSNHNFRDHDPCIPYFQIGCLMPHPFSSVYTTLREGTVFMPSSRAWALAKSWAS